MRRRVLFILVALMMVFSTAVPVLANESGEPQVLTVQNHNTLRAMLAETDVILHVPTYNNLGIAASHEPLVIPEGRTLIIRSPLNVGRDALLIIEGTLIVEAPNGRLNNQGNGSTITIAPGGTLINDQYVENVTGSVVNNYGTIVNNARFEVRADVNFLNCCDSVVTANNPLNIHRNANVTEFSPLQPIAPDGYQVTASIERLQGNRNELTIIITGGQASIAETFVIDGDVSGTYSLGTAEVGIFEVLVETLGTARIRELNVVSFTPPVYSGRIDSRIIQGTEVFVYIPDGIVLERWTAPILLVYGDVPFTADTAMRTALTSGLAAIAGRENACVAFINPIGDTWSEADLVVHRTLIASVFMERPATTGANAWYNGVTPQGRYQGFLFRAVVIADGSGADFANEFLVDDSLFVTSGSPVNHKMPASVMLFNGSTAPTEKAGEFGQEWPAVIVNGTNAANDAFTALNPGGRISVQSSVVESGFDAAAILSGYSDVAGNVLRMQFNYGTLANAPWASNIGIVDIPNYDALDVEVTSNWFTILNNAGTANLNMMYLRYIPNDLERTPGNIPVVFGFHGMGERAEYFAMLSGWAALGAEEGFMTVLLCQHLSIDFTRTMEFINMILEKYDFIDQSRVYMTGFSMGGTKTWNVAVRNPQVFAAISPWAISTTFTDAVRAGFPQTYTLPTIHLVGHHDFLNVWPSNNNTVIRHIFNINGNVPYTFNINLGTFSQGNGRWGTDSWDFQRFIPVLGGSAVTRLNYFSNQTNENIYTVLGDTTDMGHVITNYDTALAWEFMSQFSRAEDGSIIIAE